MKAELLNNGYIYENIEQLFIPEDMEIAEEEILKFTARELTIMNGRLALAGLLQIARVIT